MYNYYNSDPEVLVKKQIEAYEYAIELMPEVLKVAESFDGKVFNKRFDNALYNAVNGLYAKNDGGELKITINLPLNKCSVNNENHCDYIVTQYVLLCSCILPDTKRISCTDVKESLDEFKNNLSKEIEQMKNFLNDINEIMEERKKLKQAIKDFNEKIPGIVTHYYNQIWIRD